jgi:hypothetical protein
MEETETALAIFHFLKDLGLNYILAALTAALFVFALVGYKISRPLKRISNLAENAFTKNRNEVNIPQAVDHYKQLTSRFRGDLERLFFRTLEKQGRRLKIMEVSIRNDFDDTIRQIFEDDIDDLLNFSINGRRLSDYHKSNWHEITQLKNELLNALFNPEERAEVSHKIKLKCDSIYTSGKVWIKGEDSRPLAMIKRTLNNTPGIQDSKKVTPAEVFNSLMERQTEEVKAAEEASRVENLKKETATPPPAIKKPGGL